MAQQLGRYQLVQRLAVGGMGEVFLATDPAASNRELILKVLLPQYAADPTLLSQFYDEARLCQQLDHPNVVKVFDVAELAGQHVIAMELIRGRDLTWLRGDAKRLGIAVPVRVAAEIARDVARGLHYAHTAKGHDGAPLEVIHRDVSPGNVMVGDDGRVRLLDFGIALAAQRSVQTSTGVLKGTVSYMSPEHLDGGRLTAKSDQFALGVVLWELLAARRLFEGDVLTIWKTLQAGQFPEPSKYSPDTPKALEQVVMKMLQKDPAARFQSCAAAAEALDAWLRATPGLSLEEFVKRLGPSRDPAFAPAEAEADAVAATRISRSQPGAPRANAPSARATPPASAVLKALVLPLRSPGGWIPVGLLAGLALLFGPTGTAVCVAVLVLAAAGALRSSARGGRWEIPALVELPQQWFLPAVSALFAASPLLAAVALTMRRTDASWPHVGSALAALAWLYLPAAMASVAEHGTPWRGFIAAYEARRAPRWFGALSLASLLPLALWAGVFFGLRALPSVQLPIVPELVTGLMVSWAAIATGAVWGSFGGTGETHWVADPKDDLTAKIRRALERQELDAALALWSAAPERPPPGMNAALLLDVGRAAAVRLQHETAEQALTLAMEAQDADIAARAKVLLARLYGERLGRPAEAEVLLEDVVANFAGTDAAKVATQLLGRG